MPNIPDLSHLQGDVQNTKTEGLTVIDTAIDGLFGVANKELGPIVGDVKDFVVNFLEANLSSPAAAFFKMVLGLASAPIEAIESQFTSAIGAELAVLQHKVDGILEAA